MIIISKFILQFNPDDKFYHLEINEDVICPICGSDKLIPKGKPKRKLIMLDGEKRRLKLIRLKCRNCTKTHRVLPDIIIPYKRHCVETYNDVITNDAVNAIYCEVNTIQRIKAWWIAIQLYIKSVLLAIKEKHGIDLSTTKKLVEIVRALANTHLWPVTRSVLMPRRK